MPSQYVIGIDLGTTNSAVAFAETGELSPVALLGVTQLVNPGEVREENILPSFLFLPGPRDFPAGSTALPWDDAPEYVVGRLALNRGVENAARLVASAKSWLSHAGVDRTAAILPLSAPEGVPKVSPIEASRRYLEHIREAWDAQMPDAPFAEQQVLVTVPASFDAVARDLTLRATSEAGYRNVVLQEEPQAAFYAWIERHPDWRERVGEGDLILVVDIGGGTTDFTLIAVTQESGDLKLERVAVGEHILLGGDNMDLALARFTEQQLAEKKTRLTAMQLHALWQNCRVAKEKLLEADSKATDAPLTILGTGTGLVGGTIKAKLARTDLERIVLEGFFPQVAGTEMPERQSRAGLQEIGLPYAADPAITKHLARFLRLQSAGKMARPTHVLFNGGVLRAGLVRERLIEVLNGWLRAEGAPEVKPLLGEDLMHAVARGAAYYGLARSGKGVRIRGGLGRSYYVGIETAMPSIPGMRPPLKALSVAQFGMEEGTDVPIPNREFGLVVGQPAEFRFFGSPSRKADPVGAMIEEIGDDMEELSPIQVCLPAEGNAADEVVPVSLETVITETGVLQLWCVARDGRRWKLEFNVRERAGR